MWSSFEGMMWDLDAELQPYMTHYDHFFLFQLVVLGIACRTRSVRSLCGRT